MVLHLADETYWSGRKPKRTNSVEQIVTFLIQLGENENCSAEEESSIIILVWSCVGRGVCVLAVVTLMHGYAGAEFQGV